MLVKRNPVLPNIFNDLLNEFSIQTTDQGKKSFPAANIKETEKEFFLSLAVPGVEKKDFIIDITDNVLTISAERSIENEVNDKNYSHKEYDYQNFKRAFTLPKEIVNEDSIKATYKNGELIINIPKKEIIEEKPKLIEVK
jgi:HSP20 family protein